MSAMLLDHLTLAIRRLKTQKVRVLLTVLGIAIGIAAVLGTVSLGEGIRMQAVETIRASSDLTLIEATPGNLDGTSYLITPSSVEHIRSVPYVTASSAILKDSYASQHQTYLPVIGADGEEISKVLDLRWKPGGCIPRDPLKQSWERILANTFAGTRGCRSDRRFQSW